MFTYYYIDKYDIQTPMSFAYDRDMEYLKSRVQNGEFKELVIVDWIVGGTKCKKL